MWIDTGMGQRSPASLKWPLPGCLLANTLPFLGTLAFPGNPSLALLEVPACLQLTRKNAAAPWCACT